MPRFPYIFFDNFVVRVPLLPYKEFQEIFSESTNDEKLLEIFERSIFKESIYLASSELYREMEKSLNSDVNTIRNSQSRLKNTLLKYFNRMSNRCTPFGLFSGVAIGYFDKEEFFPKRYSDWQKLRETKVDMNFLVSLSHHLLSVPDIKEQLLFFPNNSIYIIGNKIRYIEYETKGMNRYYSISSAPFSKELERILGFSKDGKTVSQLSTFIKNEEISSEEVLEYIEELIVNRVLVSELKPNISGIDFLDSIISVLNRIEAHKVKSILVDVKSKVSELDNYFENHISSYTEIEKLIETLNVKYEQKYLFQTDLYFDNKVRLSHQWKRELKKGISFLSKTTLSNFQNTHLEKFKTGFYERFGSEEIPLAFALDTETGIDYRQDVQAKDKHPYLEDLELPLSKKKGNLELRLNPFQIILNEKLQEAFLERKYSIELLDEDFSGFEENWNDLANTLYFTGEFVSVNNDKKMVLNFGSGNASKLLARFYSEKSDINPLIKEISKKEKEFSPDSILAEIIHLPEARTGNILRRPQIREYEIPYIAKSVLPKENQIPIQDLYLSIKNEKLVLRSKSRNKEVIPSLTNAHNYSSNSLPVYHFLCDLGNQNTRPALYFDWGDLGSIYHFLPRIEYGNMIFSKARWKINANEIKSFLSLLKDADKENTISQVENWRKKRQIPQWIQWTKLDNTLVINLKNWDLVTLFFLSVKNENKVVAEEFLCNEDENFASQFIFPLYKDLD